MNDTILLERDGPVATLTLNRPKALNTLDAAMVDALVACSAEVAADDSLAVVVLRGAGNHFMAGGDIRTFAESLPNPPVERQATFQRMIERVNIAMENLHRMPHPLIGRVHGAVAGLGLSLVAACDMVVASDDAYFASAYRHIALSPDGGGSWTLPRVVGLHKAMEILLLGERFDAAEAMRIGIVNKVVPAAALDATVATIVDSLVKGPRFALRNARRLVRDALERPLSETLQAEAVSFGRCTGTTDFDEGITAFLGKRQPRYDRG